MINAMMQMALIGMLSYIAKTMAQSTRVKPQLDDEDINTVDFVLREVSKEVGGELTAATHYQMLARALHDTGRDELFSYIVTLNSIADDERRHSRMLREIMRTLSPKIGKRDVDYL